MRAAAGEGGASAGARSRPSWYLGRDEIERRSPSRRDGVGAAREAELRATYCCFIRDVCARLRLPHLTLATAILLCHRFYLRQSHARNEWQIEETPCQLRRVVTVAYETMYRKNPDAAKRIHQNEVLEKQKALILVGETLLLSTIQFDFDIQHPYEPLKLALKNLGITQKEVKQASISLINDTLPTTLALQFKPHYIAAGSLFLAMKLHNISLSETAKKWWKEYGIPPEQLEVVLQQMTELFKKRDPCSMGPVIKPTLIPTPMDKQQMISTPSPVIKPPPTPALMDRQHITSTQDPAPRHAQYSRRRISNSYKVPSRCLHLDSSSCNKSICSLARDEQNQSPRDHSLNIVIDQRSEKQSSRGIWKADHVCHVSTTGSKDTSRGTLKADHVRHVSAGPKDTSIASIRDLTRQKRKNQEIGGYPAAGKKSDQGAWMGRQLRSVIVIETDPSWKRQKVERG